MTQYATKDYPNVHAPIIELFSSSIGGDARLQPKWKIPDKIVIKCAPLGTIWDRNSNPNQPYTTEETVKEACDAIDAGACSIHLHVRDEAGHATTERMYYQQVVDPLRKRYGDRVHLDGESVFGETFDASMDPITSGLFESSYVNATATYVGDALVCMPPSFMKAQAEVIQRHNRKPIIAVYNQGDLDNAYRYLIQPGVIQPPFEWIVIPGLPGCTIVPNAVAMCEAVLPFIYRIREMDPADDPFIMVCGGGRSSSYLTALGIILGLHIRLGMEDTIWRYPHQDEIVSNNKSIVEEAVAIARLLGREPATADEYRKMVGIKK
jgi:3-keto-5-aminohexanoate cleavage enzyme